jgi:hypothetical protein
MDVIFLGRGARTEAWIDLVARQSGMSAVAAVEDIEIEQRGDLPVCDSLQEAPDSGVTKLAIVSGQASTRFALEALAAGIAVIMDEPGVIDVDLLSKLRESGSAGPPLMTRPWPSIYTRCRWLLRRILSSGHLGHVGHVACVDQRAEPWRDQLSLFAQNHMAALIELFSAELISVMVRTGSGSNQPRATEAFLEMGNGVHIHYTGTTNAPGNEHWLWLEGSKASLKTDTKRVWWRKKSWPVFVLVQPGFGPADANLLNPDRAALVEMATAVSERRPLAANRTGFEGLTAAVAITESAQRGDVVRVAKGVF